MTRQRPPELFSERPVRSDFSRPRYDKATEKKYARRRKLTLAILALIAGGGLYAAFGHHVPDPASLPVIHAEGDYKQKPADPGGIDIPHQDVRVYDQLEGKQQPGDAQPEHLLPPPEVPREMPKPQAQTAGKPLPEAPAEMSAPAPMPQAAVEPASPQPDAILPAPKIKTVATTVTPAPVPVPPVAPAPAADKPPLSIDQVIAETRASSPAAASAPKTSGAAAIQLASTTDEAKAHAMMLDLQKKYAAQLGDTQLQIVRADLGAKGVYYRIEGRNLSDGDADHICAQLKQIKAGCILVRK